MAEYVINTILDIKTMIDDNIAMKKKTDNQTKTITISMRGIDPLVYRYAKANAVLHGITTGEWINQALKEKLEREGEKPY